MSCPLHLPVRALDGVGDLCDWLCNLWDWVDYQSLVAARTYPTTPKKSDVDQKNPTLLHIFVYTVTVS